MRKGYLLFAGILVVTLTLGTACGSASEADNEAESGALQDSEDSEAVDEGQMQDTEISEGAAQVLETETSNEPQDTDSVSEDAKEISDLVTKFADAYFAGDEATIRAYLAQSYEGEVEAGHDMDEVSEVSLLGLENVEEQMAQDEGTVRVSVRFLEKPEDDFYQYLSVELVRETDGWKISFYGREM